VIEHIAIAVLIQVIVALLVRSWTAGTAAACAWSISREITQAEYRWIEQYGNGLRANMPWWGGFEPGVWHLDALLDWIIPSAVVIAIAFAARSLERSKTG
jgi:hypothetical protein